MRSLLVIAVLASLSLVLATCSGDNTPMCICKLSDDATGDQATLMCGNYGCFEQQAYFCDVSGAEQLGINAGCVDGGVSDLFLQSPCDPSHDTCPAQGDGGEIQLTCDPVARRCCVPSGAACASTLDCCEGHECVPSFSSVDGGNGLHCGS